MMVLFQNKIIYMPGSLINPKRIHQFANNLMLMLMLTTKRLGVPLGAKRETLQDYKHLFKGIQWHEHHNHIATSDGKRLSSVTATTGGGQAGKKHILVLYLQGYLLLLSMPFLKPQVCTSRNPPTPCPP